MKLTQTEKQVLLDALRKYSPHYLDPAGVTKKITKDELIKKIEKSEEVCPQN